MSSNLYSYLIASDGPVWDQILQSLGPVDCLPDCDVDTFDTMIDYLATECRIQFLGRDHRESMGHSIVVSRMTWQDAKDLQTRLVKCHILSLDQVMSLYGKVGRGGIEWRTYFERQRTLFASDTQFLVLVVSTDSSLLTFQAYESMPLVVKWRRVVLVGNALASADGSHKRLARGILHESCVF